MQTRALIYLHSAAASRLVYILHVLPAVDLIKISAECCSDLNNHINAIHKTLSQVHNVRLEL